MLVIPSGVKPIDSGYVAALHMDFDPIFFDLFCRAPRLIAQFRQTLPSTAVLFQADTVNGSIRRDLPYTVSILLPATATSAMAELSQVLFDLVAIEGGVQSPIPGLFMWPVKRTVTRDVH